MGKDDNSAPTGSGRQDEGTDKSGPLVNVTVGEDALGFGKAAHSPAARTIATAVTKALSAISEPVRTYLSRRAEDKAISKGLVERAKAERQVVAIAADIEDLRARTTRRLVTKELWRQANIEAATTAAIAYAEERNSSDATIEIDEDWIAQWLEGVKDISSPELQALWAKLLVSQAIQNGTRVPAVVVNLLKNLDGRLARCFQTFVAFTRTFGCYPNFEELRIAEPRPPLAKQDEGLLEELGFLRRVDLDYYEFSDFACSKDDFRHRQLQLTHRADILASAIFGSAPFEARNFGLSEPSLKEQAQTIASILRIMLSLRPYQIEINAGSVDEIKLRVIDKRYDRSASDIGLLHGRVSDRLYRALSMLSEEFGVDII